MSTWFDRPHGAKEPCMDCHLMEDQCPTCAAIEKANQGNGTDLETSEMTEVPLTAGSDDTSGWSDVEGENPAVSHMLGEEGYYENGKKKGLFAKAVGLAKARAKAMASGSRTGEMSAAKASSESGESSDWFGVEHENPYTEHLLTDGSLHQNGNEVSKKNGILTKVLNYENVAKVVDLAAAGAKASAAVAASGAQVAADALNTVSGRQAKRSINQAVSDAVVTAITRGDASSVKALIQAKMSADLTMKALMQGQVNANRNLKALLDAKYPITSPEQAIRSTQKSPGENDFAFFFDIDGVIQKSGSQLPNATKALQFLHKNNLPYIFLTNSGGRPDAERAQAFETQFDVPVYEENFMQSHTPFRNFVDEYKGKCILVVGGARNECRNVAEQYGFTKVITPSDLYAHTAHFWPFDDMSKDAHKLNARALPLPPAPADTPYSELDSSKHLQISAVFVYSSSRDWGHDFQAITDLLLTHEGYWGTTSPLNGDTTLPNNGYQMGNSVQIFFSNRDVLWATKHPQPRFAQGAFKAGLKAIWEVDKPAGTELLHTAQFGKPEQLQYEYAEAKMNKYRAQLLGEDAPKLRTCYMVGDNEESDIAGANNYVSPHGTKWESLLVESGVYKKGAVPKVQPTYIVAGVADAVKLACEREGFEAKFEF